MRETIMMIRNAVIEDAKALSKIKIETWRYTYKGMIDQSILDDLPEKETPEKWANILKTYHGASDRVVFVTEIENSVVGYAFGILLKDNPLVVDLIAIYVLPECHKRGIGMAMVKAILQHFSEVTSMIVWVLKGNPAERFYQKLGGIQSKVKLEPIGDMEYEIYGYEYDHVTINNLRAE